MYRISKRLVHTSFSPRLLQYFAKSREKYEELGRVLENSMLDNKEMRRVGKQYAELKRLVTLIQGREMIEHSLEQLDALEKEELQNSVQGDVDPELKAMIAADRVDQVAKLHDAEQHIMNQLIPMDDDDNKGVVVEVRAGTGGDEASLFAGEIFRMYASFSQLKGWKWEQLSLSKTEAGGFKEAQAIVTGDSVHRLMKFESGVHRVQRIPFNDTKIQTSAASVIVMPEAEEVDVELRPQDLRIDVFRSQGAGGQSVNKTESAVRITHIPTGCVVSMQDERSQILNRQRAMQYLRARVYDLEKRKMEAARTELRTLAHGTGDRSDKIRTYNFPQDRVTDHRVSFTLQGVDRVLSGVNLDLFIEKLLLEDEKEKLEVFMRDLENDRVSSSTKSSSNGGKKKT